ncbi:FUN14 domain-containing protein 1 [Hondaea fermentalgiana]|uniref:FUN14 domain-containing protein 1 n=1 Tax=Hondaea fermentalgiana TaxID=2315210 RepID=A0A2R5GK35_9STRA|nr:FUN14 domain-containing protein 1 [Hondaea fermentalgiana]|eukprot:GBG28641.1 FUN14 domain-containing protein 1 [Hondaea fermentalgiana]
MPTPTPPATPPAGGAVKVEEDDLVTRLVPAGTQLGVGTAAGLTSGFALRQGGKVAAVVLGSGFVFVQSLAYLGYIDVNWRKVQRDYYGILDMNGDGKITSEDFRLMLNNTQELLKFNMPAGSGFASGFAYGLTRSMSLAFATPFVYGGATSLALGGVPTDLFSKHNLEKGADSLRRIGSKFGVPGTNPVPYVDPKVILAEKLNARSIEELRQIEWEVKNDVNVATGLYDLPVQGTEKAELLDMIETSKKIVKGR